MPPLTIDLLCNDGSPLGVIPEDIEVRGVGGAELAMLTLMATFAERGHKVRVYNDPRLAGVHGGVEFLAISGYDNRSPRDALIVFRSPNGRYVPRHMPPEVVKIWWSTDQYTIGDFRALAYMVDRVVTISEHHTAYLHARYGIPLSKMGHFDLGVRLAEYDVAAREVERDPQLMIHCSIPDRGLDILHAAWPLIRRDVPNARLAITSDYRLWGTDARNTQHRLKWASHEGIDFLGKVDRSKLVRLQSQASLMVYPCIYDELFCISAAECQVAGALPVTSAAGALPTTNEWGILIPGDPRTPDFVRRFSERVVALMTKESAYLEERRATMMAGARRRFDWNHLAEQWEQTMEKAE